MARIRRYEESDIPIVDVPDEYAYKTTSNQTIDLTVSMSATEDGAPYQSLVLPSTLVLGSSRSGSSLPNWKALVASNLDATTAFTASRSRMSPGFGSATQRVTQWQPTVYVIDYKFPNNHGVVGTNLPKDDSDQLARIKFYKKLRRELYDAGALPFLGEFNKTMNMIRNPARALSELADSHLRDLRNALETGKGRPTGGGPKRRRTPLGKKDLHELGKSWLEFSFGAAPLIGDIQDGAKALASLHGQTRSKRITARAETAGQQTFEVERFIAGSGIFRGLYYTATVNDLDVSQTIYRAGLKAECEVNGPVDALIKLGSRLGLAPGQLVSAAYELTPWSFLADYMSTLGDVVNAYAVSTADLAWINKTSRVETTRRVSSEINYAKTNALFSGKAATVGSISDSVSKASSVTRNSVASVPVPKLELRSNLSPMKLANIAGLLAALGLG